MIWRSVWLQCRTSRSCEFLRACQLIWPTIDKERKFISNLGWICRSWPDSSKRAASGAAKRENRLNSRYAQKSAVTDCKARGSRFDFMLTSIIHIDLSKIISYVGITSVKYWADESNEKWYNMRTNQLSSTNGSINALNLICYHQQWGSTGSMAAMMIITN